MPSVVTRPSWRAFLALPHVRAFFVRAMLARLAYAMVGFSLLLLLQRASGSFSLAGAGLVAYGLTASLLAPWRARLVDRWGARRCLPPLAVGSSAVFVLLAVTASGLSPTWLVTLAGLCGCLLPPLGPVTRGVWADTAPDAGVLRAAYSLDTVAEEALFTVGPLLVGGLIVLAGPETALTVTAALLSVGTVAMAQSPALRQRATRTAPQRAAGASPWSRSFLLLLTVMFAAGLGLGGIELVLVAVADEAAGPGQAGVLLALLAVGSALGGGVYGARLWRGTGGHHLVATCLALGLGLGLLAVATRGPGAAVAGAAVLVGVFVAPLLVAAYTSADALADPAARTQASAWVNTVNNLGTVAGLAAAGVLLDRVGVTAALCTGGAALLLAAGLAGVLAGGAAPTPTPGPQPPTG